MYPAAPLDRERKNERKRERHTLRLLLYDGNDLEEAAKNPDREETEIRGETSKWCSGGGHLITIDEEEDFCCIIIRCLCSLSGGFDLG